MDGLEFELHKVEKEIKRHGNEYVFYRGDKNEFGEKIGEEKRVCVVKGIYHEERGYVSLKTQEGANIKSKSEPQILCAINRGDDGSDDSFLVPYESLEGDSEGIGDKVYGVNEKTLKQGDIVYIGVNVYKVVNITDVQNYGIIANISLELVV